jgi:hypothetical protein
MAKSKVQQTVAKACSLRNLCLTQRCHVQAKSAKAPAPVSVEQDTAVVKDQQMADDARREQQQSADAGPSVVTPTKPGASDKLSNDGSNSDLMTAAAPLTVRAPPGRPAPCLDRARGAFSCGYACHDAPATAACPCSKLAAAQALCMLCAAGQALVQVVTAPWCIAAGGGGGEGDGAHAAV